MAIDRTNADADAKNIEEEPRPERSPPLRGQLGVDGFPSRADSRRGAALANNTEQQLNATGPGAAGETSFTVNDDAASVDTLSGQDTCHEPVIDSSADGCGLPIDRSGVGSKGPEPSVSEYTPEQLTRLREAENDIRELADQYGVRVDYTTHPIDPANATEFNKAIARMAHEYPDVFHHVENIKILDSDGMAEVGSDARNTLGHTIHKGDRKLGGDLLGPGIYLSRQLFADKNATDENAALDREKGWNVSGSAEGTLYHEFGHAIDNQLRKNPEIVRELHAELGKVGLYVDEDSLAIGVPSGAKTVAAGLSKYGSNNTREMIAKGFSEWKLEEYSRPIARAIGAVIDRYFKVG